MNMALKKERRIRGHNARIYFSIDGNDNLELLTGLGAGDKSDVEDKVRTRLLSQLVSILYPGIYVGDIEEISVSFDQGVDGYRELGKRTMMYSEGGLEITGSISRGMVNKDFLKLAMGVKLDKLGDVISIFEAGRPRSKRLSQLIPIKFNILFRSKDDHGEQFWVKLFNVMISNWSTSVSATDFIMENSDFVAEDIEIIP